MTQHKTASGTGPTRQPSMADAIARAKAAARAADGARTLAANGRVFHTDLRIPNHPDAHMVRRGAVISLVAGALAIILLPDTFMVHLIGFAAMFALLFICAPTFVLHADGSLARGKLLAWSAVLLFIGAMTAVAAGPTGNLWSWSPWMSQFSAGSSSPNTVQHLKP